MNKKGLEISPPSLVVVIILLLFVLVVLVFIFGGQSGEFLKIINKWRGDITSEDKCESSILGRYCGEPPCGEGLRPRKLPPPPSGDWIDCTEGCYECIPE